jgi:OmpA-OmpF porin, OOP family
MGRLIAWELTNTMTCSFPSTNRSAAVRALRGARLTSLALLATAVVAAAPPARAQTADGFALNRFEPSGGGSQWFTLESLDFRGHGRPAGGLFLDWAHKPLVLYDRNDVEQFAIVERQILGHAGLAVNLFDRLRLGLSIPIILNAKGENARAAGVDYAAPDGAALGDVRLAADLLLFGRVGGPIRLAIGALVHTPTGSQSAYAGDEKVRVTPRLMLAGDAGPFAWAARLGVHLRSKLDPNDLQGLDLGHELTGAVAAGLRLGDRVLIGPELVASSALEGDSFLEGRTTPTELILGAHIQLARDWMFSLGGAPGLTQGLGTPKFRALARLEFFPGLDENDRDRDGVLDPEDACPRLPGVRTGDPKTNGCPQDRDGDGIYDTEDACPTKPGPRTNDDATNGCPPPDDRDADGIVDGVDACPLEPGPKNEDPKKNGCPPPPDRDGDGIADTEDACPEIPGKRTDDPRTNGCADRDGDDILDPIDACPEAPGPANADPRKHGCPAARVEKGQIRIIEQVKFKTASAVILPESEEVLEAVAKILRDNPEIKKVRVEGHTDNRGTATYNKGLSNRRAASVMKWLVGHGIERVRLTSAGFGLERPIAPNDTEEGRRENRRVEFHIVDPPTEKP